jgi:hypothetical protein
MLANTKIFQIYYKPEQKAELDPDFIPYDNTENPKPELREWYVWDKEYEKLSKEDIEYWGFLSPKFKHKTNLTGQLVHEFINANPNYDVYLFNPCIANEAIFPNSWEQGDIHHPNISLIANIFLNVIIAVVSSMTKCAASNRLPSDSLKYGESARPYTPLRPASNNAPPSAPPTEPPVPMTVIADN